MLQAGKGAEFSRAFGGSDLHHRGLSIYQIRSQVCTREQKPSVPYPWQGLNKKLIGLRQGELVTFTGGTGLVSLL